MVNSTTGPVTYLRVTPSLSRQALGFTLIEMLITIAIMAIIGGMGGAYLIPQLQQLEATNTANELKSFIITGKQDALIYQKPITLCVANANQTCVLTGGESLLEFIDVNDNQAYDAGTDKLNNSRKLSLNYGNLRTVLGIAGGVIILKPDSGRPIGYIGHIKYCPTNGNTANMLKVSFNMTGIVKIIPNREQATGCP